MKLGKQKLQYVNFYLTFCLYFDGNQRGSFYAYVTQSITHPTLSTKQKRKLSKQTNKGKNVLKIEDFKIIVRRNLFLMCSHFNHEKSVLTLLNDRFVQ